MFNLPLNIIYTVDNDLNVLALIRLTYCIAVMVSDDGGGFFTTEKWKCFLLKQSNCSHQILEKFLKCHS